MRLGSAITWTLTALTIGHCGVAAQAVAPSARQQIEVGKVLPFHVPEGYCLQNVRTAFPRVPAGARWQDVLATAVAIAEVLGGSSHHHVKVSITRDDVDGISLPDGYYRLAEVYLNPVSAPSLEVVQNPHTLAALRAYVLREELAATLIDKGVEETEAYARANAEALRRLHLPADTRMPPMRDYDYVTTIARAELQVAIGAEARIALAELGRKCP